MIKFTDKAFENFCDALNHRMTRIEANVSKLEMDVKWIRWVGYYMAGLISTLTIKLVFF